MADDMPTKYEYETTTTTTTTTESSSGIGPQMQYLKSIPGILQIVEIVLSLIVFICASIPLGWVGYGGGWVQFVSMTAFLTTAAIFVIIFLNILPRLPGPWTLILFIYYAVFVVLYLIAAIVCAVRAPYWSAVGAAAFFAFVVMIVYGVDAFFRFRTWREGGPQPQHTSTHQETHTTETVTTETVGY
ncbi:plasmolipin [Lingula anatina]|uniref:Plasmolipin n=1 Tax=Lingula anatina TaxID=7574 RepID=A0A1S3J1K0_LINAN|nr:plasmolipin [Lingula anatina]|eukprot:XP_013403699.1 plasmolipin [Lingula anatina]